MAFLTIIALPLIILALPIILMAYTALFIAGLFLFGIYHLQTPRKYPVALSLRDVLYGRILKLIGHVLQPYIEWRAAIFCKKAISLIKKNNSQFDLVIAHDNYSLPAAQKIKARAPETKIIYDAVEIFADLSSTSIKMKPAFLQRRAHRHYAQMMKVVPDRIITYGEGVARWFQNYYKIKKPDVILNCRSYRKYKADSRLRHDCGLAKQPDIKIIACLNTLYTGQGLEMLIHCMEILPPHIHLATIGWEASSGYMAQCLKSAEQKGQAHRIHYLPRRTTEDLVPYASGADLCVIPRQHNNSINNFFSMPNRIFDAMMARLPIASSDLIDHKFLIEQDYQIGQCFDQNDPQAMADTIMDMLRPEKQDYYRANLENAVRILCWENEGESFRRIVEETAKGNNDYQREYFHDAFDIAPEKIPQHRGGQKQVSYDYPKDLVDYLRIQIKSNFFEVIEKK